VIADVLGVLNGRDRRLAEDVTLAELASEFGVSRVRQIEVRVFEKVQKAVKNGVAAIGTPVHQPMHELPGLSRWREKLPMDCRYGCVLGQPNHAKKEPFTEPLARRSMHGTLRHRSGA
jgi:hypothetical protein